MATAALGEARAVKGWDEVMLLLLALLAAVLFSLDQQEVDTAGPGLPEVGRSHCFCSRVTVCAGREGWARLYPS